MPRSRPVSPVAAPDPLAALGLSAFDRAGVGAMLRALARHKVLTAGAFSMYLGCHGAVSWRDPMLARLVAAGLVTRGKRTSLQTGHPPVAVYSLTPAGRAALPWAGMPGKAPGVPQDARNGVGSKSGTS